MRLKPIALVVLLATLTMSIAAGSEDGFILAVTGDIPTPQNYTLSDIKMLTPAYLTVSENGTDAAYEGVQLKEFLSRAGAPLGPKYKGRALMTGVVVHSADGSQALFSLTEAQGVILAWSKDNQPLSPPVGPLRLIGFDSRQARWLRQVTAIQLVRFNVPAITNAADVPPPGIAAPK